MNTIVIGCGSIGSAVGRAMDDNGHKVVIIGRKSDDYHADMSDPRNLKGL